MARCRKILGGSLLMSDVTTTGATVDRTQPIAEAGCEYLLRSGMAFLNHGSFGACPRPVFEVYQGWQRELALQPVEFLARRHHDLLGDAREQLAAYVGT